MNTPLNPDAIEHAIKEVYGDGPRMDWPSDMTGYQTHRDYARTIVEQIASAYLAVAQPVVNSVEVIPAKMRMLAWEGGEFEVGEIPEGHVLVGFEMATDRAWSMADKVTIHIERKAATNGR